MQIVLKFEPFPRSAIGGPSDVVVGVVELQREHHREGLRAAEVNRGDANLEKQRERVCTTLFDAIQFVYDTFGHYVERIRHFLTLEREGGHRY